MQSLKWYIILVVLSKVALYFLIPIAYKILISKNQYCQLALKNWHFNNFCQKCITSLWSVTYTGCSDFKLSKIMAVELKRRISDPILAKPKCVFTIYQKIYRLSKAFWLYQFWAKNTPFKFYSHLLLTFFNRNNLYKIIFLKLL